MIKKDVIKTLFHLFCGITTALVLFIGIQGALIASDFSFNGWDMLRLLSVSLSSSLPSLLVLGQESKTRGKGVLLITLHFILTAGAVFGLLILYEWIDASTAFFTVVFFLALYIAAYTILEIRAKRLARILNERINAFHETENETHND